MSFIKIEMLSYKWGCWWFHMWLNQVNLSVFRNSMSSPRFSSFVPWWKYFPENPRLNRKPGTSSAIRFCVDIRAWMSSGFSLVPRSPTKISSTSTRIIRFRLMLNWPWLRYDSASRKSSRWSQNLRPAPKKIRWILSSFPWSCKTVVSGGWIPSLG